MHGISLLGSNCGGRYSLMILIGFSNIVFAGYCLFKLKLERKAQLCMIFVLIAHAATSLLIIILLITFMFKQEFCSFYFCHQQIDTTEFFKSLRQSYGSANLHLKCKQIDLVANTRNYKLAAVTQFVVEQLRTFYASR